jgi:hypothetical protein
VSPLVADDRINRLWKQEKNGMRPVGKGETTPWYVVLPWTRWIILMGVEATNMLENQVVSRVVHHLVEKLGISLLEELEEGNDHGAN